MFNSYLDDVQSYVGLERNLYELCYPEGQVHGVDAETAAVISL